MTFIEIFEPGMRHWREQKELEKVLVVDSKKGGRGRLPDDLDSGSITIEAPTTGEVGWPGGVQPE